MSNNQSNSEIAATNIETMPLENTTFQEKKKPKTMLSRPNYLKHPIKFSKEFLEKNKAKLIFFITPAVLTGVISHFSILLLILFEFVFPASQTKKAIGSYINSGSAISAAIAVIITTIITHLFNPKFSLKLTSLRSIFFTLLTIVIVVLGLINLMLINFTIEPKILSINSLNTLSVSITICILALIITYFSFKTNYEPDAAQQYIENNVAKRNDLKHSIQEKEVDDKYADN